MIRFAIGSSSSEVGSVVAKHRWVLYVIQSYTQIGILASWNGSGLNAFHGLFKHRDERFGSFTFASQWSRCSVNARVAHLLSHAPKYADAVDDLQPLSPPTERTGNWQVGKMPQGEVRATSPCIYMQLEVLLVLPSADTTASITTSQATIDH